MDGGWGNATGRLHGKATRETGVASLQFIRNLVVMGGMLEKSNVPPIDKSSEYGYDTKGVVLGITDTSKTILQVLPKGKLPFPLISRRKRNVGWC